MVPGCQHAVFLDLHHLVPRSEGGGHELDTMALMCGAHHSAVHRGQVIVEGRVSTGLVFRHADGSPYARGVEPRVAAAHSLAFVALRKLGFRETETRRALDSQRSERDVWRASAQQALDGLARAMDDRFQSWALTPAEREVALGLLKGRSHKAIAYETGRSERTIRQHAVAVYQKSKLGGRAELSAFFLEGLMLPATARRATAAGAPSWAPPA